MHDPWDKPGLVTRVSGVHRLTAGKHASAVIDSDHKLHMWGRLLSKVRRSSCRSWQSTIGPAAEDPESMIIDHTLLTRIDGVLLPAAGGK